MTGTLAAAALTVFVLWPNGDYRPLQPGERGTLQGGVEAVADIPTGRPGLTEQRESELGGAPTRIERYGSEAADRPASEDGAPDPTGSSGAGEPREGPGSERGGSSREAGREPAPDREAGAEEDRPPGSVAPPGRAPRERVPTGDPDAPAPGRSGGPPAEERPGDGAPREPRTTTPREPTTTTPQEPPTSPTRPPTDP